MSSKWRPFCLGPNVLKYFKSYMPILKRARMLYDKGYRTATEWAT